MEEIQAENIFLLKSRRNFDWSKQNVNTDGPRNDWLTQVISFDYSQFYRY